MERLLPEGYHAPFIGRLLFPRVVTQAFEVQDRALAPTGLTCRQALILLSCDLNEGSTAVEMAGLYGLEASSITRLVDRLEKKRLIARRRSRSDRRKSVLSLTDAGRTALREAVRIATPIAVAMWKGVTEKERQVLASVMRKVLANLESIQAGPRQ